jgi:nitrate reductase gamma subunit
LNIYLGTQVNYLDYLSLFNALTIIILACVGVAIILGMVGLWKVRFRSVPLVLISLASSAFLILLFLID